LLARAEAHLIPDANHISLLQQPALDHLVEHLRSDLAAAERARPMAGRVLIRPDDLFGLKNDDTP